MGGEGAVTDSIRLTQQREGCNGGVAAQIHLTGGGKVAQRDAAILLHADKGGFGVLELAGNLLHHSVAQFSIRQDNTCLISAKHAGGKSIHHISLHLATSFST